MIEDERFAGWHRPDGWRIVGVGRCRGCGERIAWTRTLSGATAPLDRDGLSHFASCPEAKLFRRSRELQPR